VAGESHVYCDRYGRMVLGYLLAYIYNITTSFSPDKRSTTVSWIKRVFLVRNQIGRLCDSFPSDLDDKNNDRVSARATSAPQAQKLG
jgi:hypothetical protein